MEDVERMIEDVLSETLDLWAQTDKMFLRRAGRGGGGVGMQMEQLHGQQPNGTGTGCKEREKLL